jgi:hypothetical protein
MESENDFISMPLRRSELVMLMRWLVIAFESERTNASDKEVITELRDRINRFAERQGAWWDK